MTRKRPPARKQQKTRKEINDNSRRPDEVVSGDRYMGLVVTRYGASLDVEDDDGKVRRCTSRRKFGAVVCGDRVIWQPTLNDEGVIVEVLPRKTLLARPDDIGRDKPIAANIDQIIIVATAIPKTGEQYSLYHNLIDRYIVAAENMDIRPVVLINKYDLLNEPQQQQLESDTAIYHRLGYPVLFTSTKTQKGMESLFQQLKEHTSIFVGESGVGKSSIIKQLLPEEDIRVGEVSEYSGKGKHTTTTAALYHLPIGGDLIDSPGVREFGLGKIDQRAIAYGFTELRQLDGQCRFNDCRHLVEPGCAVINAVESGAIDQRRYENYIQIMESEID